jgi:AcrR family transcriptional regulator
MRLKDENKHQAIFDATIQLINEIGLSDLSMSKIARRAKLSSATIYVYYENKEDLLLKLYLDVKGKMSRSMLLNVHDGMDTKELCHAFMRNSLDFILNNPQWFLVLEQFSTSPIIEKLCVEDTAPLFAPIFKFVEEGQRNGELKQVEISLLLTYCYFPIVQLAKSQFNQTSTADAEAFEAVFALSWDAIRLK